MGQRKRKKRGVELSPLERAIVRRMREARLRSGLSQGLAGRRMGYSQAMLSRIEGHLYRIRIFDLEQASKVYGRPASWYVKRAEADLLEDSGGPFSGEERSLEVGEAGRRVVSSARGLPGVGVHIPCRDAVEAGEVRDTLRVLAGMFSERDWDEGFRACEVWGGVEDAKTGGAGVDSPGADVTIGAPGDTGLESVG